MLKYRILSRPVFFVNTGTLRQVATVVMQSARLVLSQFKLLT